MMNGLLVKKSTSGRYLPLIPKGPVREKILGLFHEDPISGHQNPERSTTKIKERFYWDTIAEEVACQE